MTDKFMKRSIKFSKVPITVKVSAVYTVCSILQKIISTITIPLFTSLLTTEQYGQFTIYSSWSGILSVLLTLNLAYGSFSTAMIKFEDDRDTYISSVQGICLLLTAVFLVLYVPFRRLWNQLFELPTFIVCLMAMEVLCSTGFLLWCGKKRFEFKYKSVVALTLIMSVIGPLLSCALVVSTDEKGYARIVGFATASICVGGIIFLRNIVKGKTLYKKEYWEYAFGFNVPLLAFYLSQYIFNQSDRIMISHMEGTDKAGIYGVAYSLAFLMTFVLNAINNAYVPWYYGKIKEGKMEDNRKVANAIAFLMMLLLSCIVWFAPEIIRIMAGEKYMEAVYVVPPVAVSLLPHFYTQLFANVEFFYEEKKKLVWASIGAAVVNIVLNYTFIQTFGFIAAAYTTLMSFIIFCYCNYLAMKKVLAERGLRDVAYDYKTLIGIFGMFGLLTVLGVALYGHFLIRLIVAAVVFVGMVGKRHYFLGFYREIRKKA